MTSLSTPRYIDDVALKQLQNIAERAMPREAGGFLYPAPWQGQWVAKLTNTAGSNDTMHFDRDEFIELGMQYLDAFPQYTWSSLTVWHSHPGGNIGPSRRDMRNRIEQMGNLVVALNNGEIIPTWY